MDRCPSSVGPSRLGMGQNSQNIQLSVSELRLLLGDSEPLIHLLEV